jgi:hypothetical protein
MDTTKVTLSALLVFLLGVATRGAFGQAAAETGLVSGLSSVSTAHVASSLGSATNRALQGHTTAGGTVSRPVTSTAVQKRQPTGSKVAGSKASTVSTTNGHSGVVTPTNQGTKLPNGIAHVWPENALTQTAPAPPQ